MSYWNARYPNDSGEYEITFGSKTREITKAVEKVCTAVMDGRVESPEDVEIVVHAHWEFYEDEQGEWWDKCSGCGGKIPNEGGYCCGLPRCPHCGAHMDEEVTNEN